MPPSQRATNKRAFSVSFEKELIASVGKACEALGIDRTAFLKQAANELYRNRYDIPEHLEYYIDWSAVARDLRYDYDMSSNGHIYSCY